MCYIATLPYRGAPAAAESHVAGSVKPLSARDSAILIKY
ncbi:hypothetical protein SAMCCGM7_pC0910 (plasmid) [Sinorhizobium americanum CCGM7]|nr:hypothetical protein SAMCCGM7_pC0910 [Sinorhizobium americanum CCGM7]